MLGVLGNAGACKHCPSSHLLHKMDCQIDVSIRAVGKRAHAMHLMTAFSTQSVIATGVGYVISDFKMCLAFQ
jgi:hypothetical protein